MFQVLLGVLCLRSLCGAHSCPGSEAVRAPKDPVLVIIQ